MKLAKLELRNFKGVTAFKLVTEGKDVVICGDNGTGKTTIMDAFMWLLFDKDSQGRKDFEIKTLDGNGNYLPGLEHEVTAILAIDGNNVELKKTYAEKMTKKRGSANATHTGHTVTYHIDGVPVQMGEYNKRIGSLIGEEDAFRLLTDPRAFNVLHWKKRREILLDIAGDVADQEVITSNPKLAGLPKILGKHSLEDYRKIIAARKSEINKELTGIPLRQDEINRSLSSDHGDPARIVDELIELRAQRTDQQEELNMAMADGGMTSLKKAMADNETTLINLRTQAKTRTEDAKDGIRIKIEDMRSAATSFQAQSISYHNDIEEWKRWIDEHEAKMVDLRAEYGVMIKQEFNSELSSNCPTCGQSIPAAQMEEAYAKAKSAFNRQKAEDLEANQTKGKQHSVEAEDLRNKITEAELCIAQIQDKKDEAGTALDTLMKSMEDLDNRKPEHYFPEYTERLAKGADLEQKIEAGETGIDNQRIKEVQDALVQIDASIESFEAQAAAVKAEINSHDRLAELDQQLKDLSAEFERIENELYLTDQFVIAKVDMLEEKINSQFVMARFKLFDTQINEGISECCETTVNGVPYTTSLNNSARINVGLDIINTLSRHYKMDAPIFIDNAEAVNQIWESDGQQIRMYVSEDLALVVVDDAHIMAMAEEAVTV